MMQDVHVLPVVILGVLGVVVAAWGLSLVLRGSAHRWMRPHSLMARSVGLLVCGIIMIAMGVVSVFSAMTIEWWMGGRDLAAVWDWWQVGAHGWLAAGLAFVLTGCWFDRAKGRARCPACWYDVESMLAFAGETFRAGRCPECGREIVRKRDAFRTRRHRGLMWLGLVLMCMSYVTLAMPRVLRHGPTGLIPTTVLLAGFDVFPDELLIDSTRGGGRIMGSGSDCLMNRMADEHSWAWQREWCNQRIEEIWERPKDGRTLVLASRIRGHWDDGYITAARARAVLEVLLHGSYEDRTEIVSRFRTIEHHAGGQSFQPVLEGRLDDVLRAVTDTEYMSSAMLLLAFVGTDAHTRWDEIRAVFEESHWPTRLGVARDSPGAALAALACTVKEADAYLRSVLARLDEPKANVLEGYVRRYGPMDLLIEIDQRSLLAGNTKDGRIGEKSRLEFARALAAMGGYAKSENALWLLHRDLVRSRSEGVKEVEELLRVMGAREKEQ